ncbi:MAG: hypothetical protein V4594_23600 [Bacteroidota bacterium]
MNNATGPLPKGKPLILLTGCINPMGMTFTKLQNPEVRREQYIEAIKFYLTTTDNNIVFVENSGVDISEEFKELNKRLEIHTFKNNSYNKDLGKGYGEMIILDYAFKNSTLVQSTSSICKITGRYRILNIVPILQSYNDADCEIMADLPKRLTYGDSRIFIAEKAFFLNFLLPSANLINDSKGVYFEHVLCRCVLYSLMEKHAYLPLKYKPRIIGQSGTDATSYDHSYWNWLWKNVKKKIMFRLFMDESKFS